MRLVSCQTKSHLLQMRGLKQKAWSYFQVDENVASFTDAWIETPIKRLSRVVLMVASFTDAWIETRKDEILSNPSLSHLLQMRGLKQQDQTYDDAQRSRIFYRCVD